MLTTVEIEKLKIHSVFVRSCFYFHKGQCAGVVVKSRAVIGPQAIPE